MRIHFLPALLLCSSAVSTVHAQSFTLLGYLMRDPSVAHDVSADGSVVVGYSRDPVYGGEYQAFRWTQAEGMVGLNATQSTWNFQATLSGDGGTIVFPPYLWTSSGVDTTDFGPMNTSYDGSIFVGGLAIGTQLQASLWSQATGFVELGFLPSDDAIFLATSLATDVSADGNVVVGYSKPRDSGYPEAFRWTPQTGMVGLGFRGTDIYVSADGSTIVATSEDGEVVRWTEVGGTQSLGKHGTPYGISGDGGRIVGKISEPAGDGYFEYSFLWDADRGILNVNDLLMDELGLGESMGEWLVADVFGISDDGRTLVGVATDGRARQAFVATIPPLSVPEPATLALAIFAGVWGFSLHRGRWICGSRGGKTS